MLNMFTSIVSGEVKAGPSSRYTRKFNYHHDDLLFFACYPQWLSFRIKIATVCSL